MDFANGRKLEPLGNRNDFAILTAEDSFIQTSFNGAGETVSENYYPGEKTGRS